MIGYYLIEITPTLKDDTLDKNGVVTKKGTKTLSKTALLELGTQSDANPMNITHLRPSLNGQKFIVEMDTSVNKTDMTSKMSEHLTWSKSQANTNTTFTKFAGSNREAMRQTVLQYLKDNSVDWEII